MDNKKDIRVKTTRLIKFGLITKSKCKICGSEDVQCHHNNYTNPYDVTWLCEKHHLEIHKKLKNNENIPEILIDTSFRDLLSKKIEERGWVFDDFLKKTGIPAHIAFAWLSDPPKMIPSVYVQDLLFFKLDRVGLPEGDFKDIQTAVDIVNKQIKKIAEMRTQIEALKEICVEYISADDLYEANSKVILICKGVSEEIGRDLYP